MSTENSSDERIYEDACGLDLYRHVADFLKSKSYDYFLGYHDTYMWLGRVFCLRKSESKKLLTSMQHRRMLIKRKRGVMLL